MLQSSVNFLQSSVWIGIIKWSCWLWHLLLLWISNYHKAVMQLITKFTRSHSKTVTVMELVIFKESLRSWIIWRISEWPECGWVQFLDHQWRVRWSGCFNVSSNSNFSDSGYDIQDFKTVDPMFGTNDDLKELFVKAKEMRLKIILDFVGFLCSLCNYILQCQISRFQTTPAIFTNGSLCQPIRLQATNIITFGEIVR